MKSLFRSIQDTLGNIHESPLQGHALSRQNNLCGFICGMIRKGNSSLSDIGSGLSKNINANSQNVAAKRFVKNKGISYELHYLPFITALLRGIFAFMTTNSTIQLVIDGSAIGKKNATLMISIVWGGRGIPLCWIVKKGSKGHFKEQDHVDVLKKAATVICPILALFPNNIPLTVLGDGEFDGINVQKFCKSKNWDYVLRTACNTVLYEEGIPFKANSILPFDKQNFMFIPHVEFTKKRFKYVNFLYWHDDKRHEDPIFLLSNLYDVEDIMTLYDLRYSIECLFKDLKSSSFNIHKTRLVKPEEVFNLLIIAALAFILVLSFGMQHDTTSWRKKIHRVRKDQKAYSIYFFAYKLVQYFLERYMPISFSFQFSKDIKMQI